MVLITVILLIVLRRVSDVLLTLVPLLLASVMTLELMVLLRLPLSFANIIAVPLLAQGRSLSGVTKMTEEAALALA